MLSYENYCSDNYISMHSHIKQEEKKWIHHPNTLLSRAKGDLFLSTPKKSILKIDEKTFNN